MAGDDVLERAYALARSYLESVGERHAGGGDAPGLQRELTTAGEDPGLVIDDLARDIDPGLVATAGPRYFGFVVGGSLPVALAADWLVSAWDQTSSMRIAAPGIADVEDVAAGWALDLLGLPAAAGVGFATGAQMANFTCLAAARGAVLHAAGWDLDADGLFGAPPVVVLVGEEVHVTVLTALRYLGFGTGHAVRVAVDDNGAMDPDSLRVELARIGGPAIVCAQAGNVNTGACDPLDAIADAVGEHPGVWLHVDGAFGLWAAASPSRSALVAGRERADSWAVDAHKWLNVPYDCALAIVADAAAHARATNLGPAAYLATSDAREPTNFVPEASRRARAVPVYAALRSLGRDGVAALVDRCCEHATLMAGLLAGGGLEILNDVVLNQVLVSAPPDHIARIQDEGTLWLGGTSWRGHEAMRVSFSNWSTTTEDVHRSAAVILATR